jgi:SAM-dependent methyltransferase
MSYLQTYYPESRFGGFTDVDGTLIFYSHVNALLAPSAVVLDIGCGRGAYASDSVAVRRNLRVLKGRCRRVIGIDVDSAAAVNPSLDEFRQIEGGDWPVEDEAVDVCISDWVLEHVEDPDQFFAEANRVLKPSGYLCLRTANARSYVGLFARLIPNRYHASLVSRMPDNKQAQDVFPTRYRCNTCGAIRTMFARYGFDGCVYPHESEPYYSFNRLSYWLGVQHQRFAPGAFRLALFAFGQKRGLADGKSNGRGH